MDIQRIINRGREQVKPVTANLTATTLVNELGKLPDAMQKQCFIADRQGGLVFIYRSGTAGAYVLESVQSIIGNTNVIALYDLNPIFNDRTKWMQLRVDLIEAYQELHDAAAGTLRAFDHQRNQQVLLGELTTAQLLGMVEAKFLARTFAIAKEEL